MRIMLLLLFLMSFLGLSGCSVLSAENRDVDAAPANSTVRRPVLVELFTSEGCSSCPPADKELTFLQKQQPVAQAEVIALAFHVDYWDSSAWRDQFSSAMYSQRQGEYAQALRLDSNYTPQMVVDGQAEFVGSNADKASKAIMDAAHTAKGTVAISSQENKLSVSVSDLPKHSDATVFLAIAEDEIFTDVKGGENGGQRLSHTSVVRELKALRPVRNDENKLEIEAEILVKPEWNKKNVKFVVFVQENDTRKVLAVGKGPTF